MAAVAVATLFVPAARAERDDWKYEVVHLKNGKAYRGLVDRETPAEVKLTEVWRRPGEKTRVFYTTFRRGEVASIDRLAAHDRAVLAARIHALDPSGTGEKLRMESLPLEVIPWGKDPKAKGLAYTSFHFVLRSNAQEDIVRRAAVRLEQIYAAYVQFLPPRRPMSAKTTILLLPASAEYQEVVKSQGRTILNPAFYDPARNLVVCGSDLRGIGAAMEQVRQEEAEWRQQVARLRKRYKGRLPAVIQARVNRDGKEIEAANQKNARVFDRASGRLFRRLYHEAFHAYLDNFVYPAAEAAFPSWLNEGLAQIFETALVEADELRVGRVDRERLRRVRELAARGGLVPLADLLKASPQQFNVIHASDRQLADRYYLTAWALAYYLWEDQKVLGDPARLDDYVRALKRGTDPLAAFRRLVGRPLERVEKDFHDHLRRLQPDGSLAPK